MKRSGESAHLFLNNDFCYVGAFANDSTFRVNFKELLGDMYDKYDKFVIIFNCYAQWSGAGGAIPSGTSTSATLRITGLNWHHSSYGTNTTITLAGGRASGYITPGNNGEAVFPQIVSITASTTTQSNFSGQDAGLCFYKPREEFTDIRLYMRDIRAATINANNATTIQCNSTFSFSIYGLYN